MIRFLIRLMLAWEYGNHKVDEYLARQRDDYEEASWSLNRALQVETVYNQI